jgi:hypothetical protein
MVSRGKNGRMGRQAGNLDRLSSVHSVHLCWVAECERRKANACRAALIVGEQVSGAVRTRMSILTFTPLAKCSSGGTANHATALVVVVRYKG